MANNVYIGMRYVPIFMGDWSNSVAYEALSIVSYGNNTYTSKKPVPVGTLPTNTDYWALTGNYNGQIAQLQSDVSDLQSEVSNMKIFNVRDYGAVGDGVTNDTAALQAAVSDLNVNGGVLYFPRGSYNLHGTLRITAEKVMIAGVGVHASYIKQYDDVTAIHVEKSDSSAYHGIRIQDLGILYMGATPTTSARALYLKYVVNSTFNNLLLSNFYVGAELKKVGNSFFTDVGIVINSTNATGISISDDSVSNSFSNIYVGCGGDALDTGFGVTMAGGRIADTKIEYLDVANGAYGVYINGSDNTSDPTNGADIRLHDIVCDGVRQGGIYLYNLGTGGSVVIDGGWINPSKSTHVGCVRVNTCRNVRITNLVCQQLAENHSAPMPNGVAASYCDHLTIDGCVFINCYAAASITNCDHVKFVNNEINLIAAYTSANYCATFAYSNKVLIANNILKGVYARGFSLDANGNHSVICGNLIDGVSGAAAISDSHANKEVANNMVV